MGLIGKRVRIVAPSSGYDGLIGTVTEDYRNPGEDDHMEAVLVEYGPGPSTDVVLSLDQVKVLDE